MRMTTLVPVSQEIMELAKLLDLKEQEIIDCCFCGKVLNEQECGWIKDCISDLKKEKELEHEQG